MVYIVGTGSVPITGSNNSSQGSAFVAKFDENLNHIWGTMLINNSSSFFILNAVEIGVNGEIIIGGSLEDPNAIPTQFHSNNIVNSYSKNHLGGFSDVFLVMLSPNSNIVLWATHIGGSGRDDVTDINVSPINGDIYVSGRTESVDLKIVNNVFLSDTLKAISDGFIMRFSPTGEQKYSSYLGTTGGDIRCFTFDYLGNAYFTGVEQSGNAGLGRIQYPSGYYDKGKTGNSQDAFIVMLNTINSPDWITYFGGNGSEVGNGITISSNHKLYLIGHGGSSWSFPFEDPFPNSTTNWYDNTASNLGDVFISKFGLTHLVSTKNIKKAENENLMVLPNISNTGVFEVQLKKLSKRNKLYVFNTLGEVVSQYDIYSTVNRINLSALSSGNYYLSLMTESSIETKKIVIIK
jgi:hypothetical protein